MGSLAWLEEAKKTYGTGKYEHDGDKETSIDGQADVDNDKRKGIDCSHLVFKIYEKNGFVEKGTYLSTSQIAGSPLFEKIDAKNVQAGDLILFKGHVGIVEEYSSVNNGKFFGSQSSTGPATAKFGSNAPYWGSSKAILGYYRVKKIDNAKPTEEKKSPPKEQPKETQKPKDPPKKETPPPKTGKLNYAHMHVEGFTMKPFLDFKVKKSINEHNYTYIRGIVEDTLKDEIIKKMNDEEKLRITAIIKEDQNKEIPIFNGMIKEISLNHENNVYILEIIGISWTALMDKEKKSKVFQDTEMTYEKLIDAVKGKYAVKIVCNPLDVKGRADFADKIEEPIIQYEETDWEFLKRIASKLGKDLYVMGDRIEIGMPKEQIILEMPESEYRGIFTESNKTGKYRELKLLDKETTWLTDEFVEKEITVNGIPFVEKGVCQHGDSIKIDGREKNVKQIEFYLEKSELKAKYMLFGGIKKQEKDYGNINLAGKNLEAEVVESGKGTVKVKFDIDKESVPKKFEIPYISPYIAGNTTGFYMMPEKGDKVIVHFPTLKEKDAKAITSIRSEKDSSSKTSNPNEKYFSGINGMEIAFKETSIEITEFGKDDEINSVVMDETKGITITSKTKVELRSEGSINIENKNGSEVSISGTKKITFGTENAAVVMEPSKMKIPESKLGGSGGGGGSSNAGTATNEPDEPESQEPEPKKEEPVEQEKANNETKPVTQEKKDEKNTKEPEAEKKKTVTVNVMIKRIEELGYKTTVRGSETSYGITKGEILVDNKKVAETIEPVVIDGKIHFSRITKGKYDTLISNEEIKITVQGRSGLFICEGEFYEKLPIGKTGSIIVGTSVVCAKDGKWTTNESKEGLKKLIREIKSKAKDGEEIRISLEINEDGLKRAEKKVDENKKLTLDNLRDDLRDKALKITAGFEGGGFDNITANFDGQGLSLGILQWNIGTGTLQPLLKKYIENNEKQSKLILGSDYEIVKEMLSKSRQEQMKWAISINEEVVNKKNRKIKIIKEEWRKKLKEICNTEEYKKIQVNGAKDYIQQACNIVNKFELKTEKGFCLAFDIAVQNWDMKK